MPATSAGMTSRQPCAGSTLLDQLADPVHESLGRGVNLPDQRLQMLAVLRLDVELLFGRIGDEILVLHGGAEGVTQHLQPVCRQARRGYERPADPLSGVKKLQRLPLLGVARLIDNERGAMEVDRRLGAAIEQ